MKPIRSLTKQRYLNHERGVRDAAILMIILLAVYGGIACVAAQHRLSSEELDDRQKLLAADLKEITKRYLVENLGMASFGGRAFCAYKVLDIQQEGDNVREYVYAVCQEYYLKAGELREGTGLALPVALLIHREGPRHKVISHTAPRDGAQYSRDVEQFFPKKTHYEIFSAGSNYRSWKVEVENEAKTYYRK